jgi:serine/threonine protein kinase
MAESIATLLHGYQAGMIFHGDIFLDQFMVSKKGNLKLNDFNDAKILSDNPKTANYCPTRGCSDSVYDAPEKLRCQRVDEKVDVYLLGNMFYFLLTGLRPFYEYGLEDMNGPVNGVRIGKTPCVVILQSSVLSASGWYSKKRYL